MKGGLQGDTETHIVDSQCSGIAVRALWGELSKAVLMSVVLNGQSASTLFGESGG